MVAGGGDAVDGVDAGAGAKRLSLKVLINLENCLPSCLHDTLILCSNALRVRKYC